MREGSDFRSHDIINIALATRRNDRDYLEAASHCISSAVNLAVSADFVQELLISASQ
jgi:hypothetical protein